MQVRDGGGVQSWRKLTLCCLLPRSPYPFPLPPHLAKSTNCGARWEKGQETSVCQSLPPTLRHKGWKSVWGPEKFQSPSLTAISTPPRFRPSARASFVRGLPGKHQLLRGPRTETGSAGFLAPPPPRPAPCPPTPQQGFCSAVCFSPARAAWAWLQDTRVGSVAGINQSRD